MPKGMGYNEGPKGKTTSSAKPTMGDYGGHFNSTPSSDNGAPPGRRETAPWGRNPKQKSSKNEGVQAPYRNTVKPGDPGNRGY